MTAALWFLQMPALLALGNRNALRFSVPYLRSNLTPLPLALPLPLPLALTLALPLTLTRCRTCARAYRASCSR